MLNIQQCFIIKNPAGTFSYVGRVPTVLGKQFPACTSAIMGGRAYANPGGDLYEWKFPVFKTLKDAVEFAAQRGVEVRT